MNFGIPQINPRAPVKLIARTTNWNTVLWLDDSHTSADIDIPPSVDLRDLEVFIEYLDDQGHVTGTNVLKTKARHKLPRRT
jgi:hypothetical protein